MQGQRKSGTAALAEQPADWTEPGAHPVVPGVHRIPLPLPLTGLTTVNAYVMDGPEGAVLIDPGWAGPENERAITAALRQIGYRLDDVDLCIATHHHWDHYTQAYAWRETLGSRLLVGRDERHSVGEFDLANGLHPEQVALLRRCGAPQLASAIERAPFREHETGVPFGPPDAWLEPYDRLPLRNAELDVVATPGHTRGHVVFRDEQAGLLFAGDHVLSRITPAIGLDHSPEKLPLRSFLNSLRLVRQMPDTLLLPAHGPVAVSTHDRIDELLEHHDERLSTVFEEVRTGAETAYEVARTLRWTRRGRHLDDLELDHQMSAVLEVYAHLELLNLFDRVEVDDDREVRRFVPTG